MTERDGGSDSLRGSRACGMRGAPEITILDSAFWWEIDQVAHCCGRCEGFTPVDGCFKGCILGVIRLKCLSVQECSGVSSVQHAGVRQGKRRVQDRVHGAQSAQNGCDADCMRQKSDRKAIDWPLRGLLKPSQVEFGRLACSQVKQKIKNDLQ